MKRKINSIIIILFVFSVMAANAQSGWQPVSKTDLMAAYQKATDWFIKTPNYKLTVTYASFVDYTTVSAFEKSEASYIRFGQNVHTHVFDTHTIQNAGMKFIVDSVNQ